MKQIKQNEYSMLREASWKRMDAQRNLSFFAVTTTITILGIGFALEEPNKYIFVLPITILLPSAAKVYQCKKAISCLGAYIIIFLESDKKAYQWETDGYLFKGCGKDMQNKKLTSTIADMEFCLLGVISMFVYTAYLYVELERKEEMQPAGVDIFILIAGFIAICIIFKITKQFSLFNKMIKSYIVEWNNYAYENKRIGEEEYKINIQKFNLEQDNVRQYGKRKT